MWTNFREIDKDNLKYDLFLYESSYSPALLGLAHKVGAPPVIGISPLASFSHQDWMQGLDQNSATTTDPYYSTESVPMTFTERFFNTLHRGARRVSETVAYIGQEWLKRKYFGPGLPSVWEMERNRSLLIYASDLAFEAPKPTLPNIIKTGALHVRQPKPLPKELEDWISGAQDGFIYFSLGSSMQGSAFPPDKREAFFQTFAKFPKIRVFWKYESQEPVPGLPPNVRVSKWFPQQDVLGHKKLRLFITQGGAQSLQESIHQGVPVLGLPLFGDQVSNMNRILSFGAGRKVDIYTLTNQSVLEAVEDLLTNPKYKENMENLRAISRDTPLSGMETAIWWIEYVIRHKGAYHLQFRHSLGLYWFQYYLLDVGLAILVLVTLSFYFFCRVASLLCSFLPASSKKQQAKKKIS